MKRWTVGALTALVVTAGPTAVLVTAAPQAAAGCVYGGGVISKCDGPVQPDGAWLRCVGTAGTVPSGFSTHQVPVRQCTLMGPGQPARDAVFTDPPAHIAD